MMAMRDKQSVGAQRRWLRLEKNGGAIAGVVGKLPHAPTPTANGPVIAMFAGERTVGHLQSRIGGAVANGSTARIGPAQVDR